MGSFWSGMRPASRFKETRIVMVGLDGAGKTTTLYKLKLGEVVQTVPTIGFNVETVEYRKLRLAVWDVGGQDRIRGLWRYYFEGSHAVIFVVDSNDRSRAAEAALELKYVLQSEHLRDVPVLVYANKQDLPHAMSVAEVGEAMGLSSLTDRKWFVSATQATKGEGLYEGLDWLADILP